MQQQGGGGGGTGSQYHHHVVEEASPISSRPPASAAATAANFDDMLPSTGDDDHVGSGGNRWPRQETLALLQIRSDMDVAFRDATLKGPLWDDVSRKLAEQGYTRSAKKCKEKFENVQKYYKRTKESRAGRQDGKSYKFFSQLEALHGTITPTITTTTASTTSNPTPIIPSLQTPQVMPPNFPTYPPVSLPVFPPAIGISFSSNSSSSSSSGSDDDGMDEFETEQSNPSTSRRRRRKRKRVASKGGSGNSSGSGNNDKMMEFFESLMKELMQKQEVIQQRFIDTIEKREKDRMIREEDWKRQEMVRINREHELMAQERAIAASRDAAVIGFLQKITGQVIQLPAPVAINSPAPTPSPPPPQPQAQPQPVTVTPLASTVFSHNQTSKSEPVRQLVPVSSETFMAVPVQQVPPQDLSSAGGTSSGGFDPTPSRWPKVEVLALIKIRSGLEGRYQEAGPKGPLWEEVSSGMLRMGYKRNPKRCKEKWENINKYFKKVKESNKTRPEDAKTCPYFHELDALYRRKILGSASVGDGSSGSSFGNQNMAAQQQSIVIHSQEQDRRNMPAPQIPLVTAESETKKVDSTSSTTRGFPGTLFEQGGNSVKNDGGHKKPEDTMKELIEPQQNQRQQLMSNDYDKTKGIDYTKDMDLEEDESYTDDDEEESEDDMKMDYKIEFQQKQNGAPPSNRGGNGASSFTTMVQ